MKVLFCNMLDSDYVKGHKNLDLKIIKAISQFSDIYIICSKEWYSGLPANSTEINIDALSNLSGRKKHYGYGLEVINSVCKLDKKQKFDFILFESYDTYLMLLAYIRIANANERVFILQHNNIDFIDHYRKARLFYNFYSKKVHHFVLGEFIRQHLITNHNIPENNVINIPHPIVNAPDNNVITEKKYDCIAISNSNDECWIQKIVELERNEHFFSDNKLKVILRSKDQSFNSEYLKVINGFMPIKEYQEYYRGAKLIFLPFPSSYMFRMSASLVDAITNESIVLCTYTPMTDYYAERYPKLCKRVDNIEEFKMALLNTKCSNISKLVAEFIRDHDDNVTLHVIKKAFGFTM